ncbi:hypothetical protein [Membranihabitans maritimus]|uniref:hypothetical protein n=1 Tax=Membranihabitans maritimus TaxID=2904244 RepID=UPI001F31D6AA|nr:hypothetical protein [Membranihabitans maritimus]
MFNLFKKTKSQTYALQVDGNHVQMPLKIEGKQINLNENKLSKGHYQWVSEKNNKKNELLILVL